MAKNDETVEPTVTFNRKKLVTAGWIAGGVLALGATFAVGSIAAHAFDRFPGGDDFANGQHIGPGPFGPQGGHGDGDGDRGGHGPRDGDNEMNDDGPGAGMTAPNAPSAPTAPQNGTTTPAPSTTP